MRTLSAFIAISSLLLGIASIATLIGAVLALFVFFPLFLLGLSGVLAELNDREVRQRNPSMNATGWRERSAGRP
jgi:hypothetical protein